jgi:hypothetical protein
LADTLKKLVTKAVPSLQRRVFVSSDGKSIPDYVKWEAAVTSAHQESSVVIALMTPNSVFRPWVIYEAGGANFQRRKPLFVVRANGLAADSLPGPLRPWQSIELSSLEDVKTLCQSVAKLLRKNFQWDRGICRIAEQVVLFASKQAGDWALVNTSLTSEVMHDSPFNLLNLLDLDSPFSAKKDICVVGQNLHTLVTNREFKCRIFKWLKNGTSTQRRFALVTCNPRQTAVVKAWQELHQSKLFIRHLNESVRTFKLWQREAQKKCRKGKLLFKPMDDFPLNITFVDPEEDSGFLVLTVVSVSGATGDRPHFIVGKHQQRHVFYYYWLPILQHLQRDPLWRL